MCWALRPAASFQDPLSRPLVSNQEALPGELLPLQATQVAFFCPRRAPRGFLAQCCPVVEYSSKLLMIALILPLIA